MKNDDEDGECRDEGDDNDDNEGNGNQGGVEGFEDNSKQKSEEVKGHDEDREINSCLKEMGRDETIAEVDIEKSLRLMTIFYEKSIANSKQKSEEVKGHDEDREINSCLKEIGRDETIAEVDIEKSLRLMTIFYEKSIANSKQKSEEVKGHDEDREINSCLKEIGRDETIAEVDIEKSLRLMTIFYEKSIADEKSEIQSFEKVATSCSAEGKDVILAKDARIEKTICDKNEVEARGERCGSGFLMPPSAKRKRKQVVDT